MDTNKMIKLFEELFNELQDTTSRVEKETIVAHFKDLNPYLVDDLIYILETLDGQHPIGWTFETYDDEPRVSNVRSIKHLIQDCEKSPKNVMATTLLQMNLGYYGFFLEPIVNRTLRLGIGKSLLETKSTAPMLAKKYTGVLRDDYAITEKLDGNRCIAYYDRFYSKWRFVSRNGKPMHVSFDMSEFEPGLIYDGEVMSTQQTKLSVARHMQIINKVGMPDMRADPGKLFNEATGLISRHGDKSSKALVYNVFDIIADHNYKGRRDALPEKLICSQENVRVLPILYKGRDRDKIDTLLDIVTDLGGEGIMLNELGRKYEQKRTDALLKYKKVQRMDMYVTGTFAGEGKYTGLVGGLYCYVSTTNGDIYCKVGTGLSDAQRLEWANVPEKIIGRVVEVGYHEITPDKSLRFPRLIRVRADKVEGSEY